MIFQVHGSLERLLQVKYLSGGFSDYNWPDSLSDIISSSKNDDDATYCCDKNKCFDTNKSEKDEYLSCCKGHYKNDQVNKEKYLCDMNTVSFYMSCISFH